MTARATILALMTGGAVLLGSTPAQASFCLVNGLFVDINPPPDSVVPPNVRVRVRLTLAAERVNARRTALRGPHWSQHMGEVEVVLRMAGDRTTGGTIPTERRVLGMENERILELIAHEPLAAGAAYEIIVSTPYHPPRPRRRAADNAERWVREFASRFTTGASTDDTPPTWAGMTGAELAGRRAWQIRRPDGSVVEFHHSDRSAPWIVARAPTASDRSTPAASLVFGIWVAGPSGRIAYDRPPLSYLSWRDGRILAGRDEAFPEHDMCDLAIFPGLDPRKPKALRIGMRAIDWAGNSSSASEVVLDSAASPPR